MLFALALPFGAVLELRGPESSIDFGNSARISASCACDSSTTEPAFDYMDPTSFYATTYPPGNVTLVLRNVPTTCVGLALNQPCALQESARAARPPMFRCKYSSAAAGTDIEWSPWLHAQRNRAEYDGLTTTEIFLTCPLPPYARMAAVSGYGYDGAPASMNITVWHGGQPPYAARELNFSGISGGNKLTINGLVAPPPPVSPPPMTPPPAPPGAPPPAAQPSCLAWKQLDPSLSGYQIKKLSLTSSTKEALCDFTNHGGGWTRVTLYTATQYNLGTRWNTASAINIPSDGIDDGYLGVGYQVGTSQETFMPSNKNGYKMTDVDINELATTIFWVRGIGVIDKSYYFQGGASYCATYSATASSTGYCSDPHETISSDGMTAGTRRDCADHQSHFGLTGWSGVCHGCNHFPHANGDWYIAAAYNTCGTSPSGYCNGGTTDCDAELWVK